MVDIDLKSLDVRSPSTVSTRLKDGRLVELDWSVPFEIQETSGRGNRGFDFSFVDLDSLLGKPLMAVFLTRCPKVVIQTLQMYNVIIRKTLGVADQHSTLKKSHMIKVVAACTATEKASLGKFFRDVLKKSSSAFDDACADYIYYFRADPRPSYVALKTNSPKKGAYTDQELIAIRSATDDAYEEGRITLREYALIWTLIATGFRPVQICLLTLEDVKIYEGPEGLEIRLAVTVVKGSGNNEKQKKQIQKAPTVLVDVLLRFISEFHEGYPESLDLSALLFGYNTSNLNNLFKDHKRDRGKITREVKAWSDRIKGYLRINPKRFRYTLGTRSVALGASDHVTARLLTHRGTGSIKSYRASLPSIQKPIQKVLSKHLNFLAGAFRGRLLNSLDEATRQDDAAIIRDFNNLAGQIIGACSTLAACYQNAPIACLTCKKIEPIKDAPWHELREKLEEDFEREVEDKIKLITLESIQAIDEILEEIGEI